MLGKVSIYDTALSVSLDNDEASIVRENSAALLTNLCSHMVSKQNVINQFACTHSFSNLFSFRMTIVPTRCELCLIY